MAIRRSYKRLKRMLRKQRRRCLYCQRTMTLKPGRPITATKDHVVPKSRGGSNRWRNIDLICASCNARKGGMTPDEWAFRQAGLNAP